MLASLPVLLLAAHSALGAVGKPKSPVDKVMDNVLGKLRVFREPMLIARHNQLCRQSMDRFSQCVVGNYEPKASYGRGLLRKVGKTQKRLDEHPNTAAVAAAYTASKACFAGCVATGEETIDCLVNVAVNGRPWDAVTECMKAGWNTPNLSLSVPELGNLTAAKDVMETLLALGITKFYQRNGEQAFRDKFQNQIAMLCPSEPESVMQCVLGELDSVQPRLLVDLRRLVRRRGPREDLQTTDAGLLSYTQEAWEEMLTAEEDEGRWIDSVFGDENDRKFLENRVKFLVGACGLVFIEQPNYSPRGIKKRFGLDLNPLYAGVNQNQLKSKPDDCSYLRDVHRCQHQLWTLKEAACDCRASLTSSGADPFDPAQLDAFIVSAQEDYVNATKTEGFATDESQCDLDNVEELGTTCATCRDLGSRMDQVFQADPSSKQTFAQDFKAEIRIVLDLMKKMCKLGWTEELPAGCETGDSEGCEPVPVAPPSYKTPKWLDVRTCLV